MGDVFVSILKGFYLKFNGFWLIFYNPGDLNSPVLDISESSALLEGSSITITCVGVLQVANNQPCVTSCAAIDWAMGINVLTSSANLDVVLSDTTLTLTSSLQLHNIDSSDDGSYTCGLRVVDTNVAARSLQLTVHGKLNTCAVG